MFFQGQEAAKGHKRPDSWYSRLYSRFGPVTYRFGWEESEQITRTVVD